MRLWQNLQFCMSWENVIYWYNWIRSDDVVDVSTYLYVFYYIHTCGNIYLLMSILFSLFWMNYQNHMWCRYLLLLGQRSQTRTTSNIPMQWNSRETTSNLFRLGITFRWVWCSLEVIYQLLLVNLDYFCEKTMVVHPLALIFRGFFNIDVYIIYSTL